MTLNRFCFIYTLCFSLSSGGLFAQQDKYALIIGVKSYKYVQPLKNSMNDAQDIASTLKVKGFKIIELYDPKTKREMQDAVKKYFALLRDKPNSAGLVFYSGHGMQVKGVNYLIPTLADPQIEADLDDQCLNMDYVMLAIEQAGNDLNIFILDACRNNPFTSFSRSSEKGLSMVYSPRGSYLVYATKPGSVASDGIGRNGLFTSKLLKFLNVEGLNIEQVFKRVAGEVSIESKDSQRPWIASDYTGDFFFTPSRATTIVSPSVGSEVSTRNGQNVDDAHGTDVISKSTDLTSGKQNKKIDVNASKSETANTTEANTDINLAKQKSEQKAIPTVSSEQNVTEPNNNKKELKPEKVDSGGKSQKDDSNGSGFSKAVADSNPSLGKDKVSVSNSIDERKAEASKTEISNNFNFGYGVSDAKVVFVGNQEWVGKNINIETFANGDVIPEARTKQEWSQAARDRKPAWCYYNNDPNLGKIYGKIYNYYALNDPRQITPVGWRVATKKDWIKISEHFGGDEIAGVALKNSKGWDASGNGSNASGLTCLPGGYRTAAGDFVSLKKFGFWWIWSGEDNRESSYVSLSSSGGSIFFNEKENGCGFSVRWVKGEQVRNSVPKPMVPIESKETLVEKNRAPSAVVSKNIGETRLEAKVTVGVQVWMAQNLNVSHFTNGDPIMEAKTTEEWKKAAEDKIPAWCHYNNDVANGVTHGRLYNWYAVNDPRGLAPKGWRVPSDQDWQVLANQLGGENNSGEMIKSTSLWFENGNGNNKSGLSATPGGIRLSKGSFSFFGKYCSWWSSTESPQDKANCRNLNFEDSNFVKGINFKGCGFSVRCIKNQ